MRNPHGIYRKILDGKPLVRFYNLKKTLIQILCPGILFHRFNGAFRGVDGDTVFPGNHTQATDMITMFVGHKNSINITTG